MMTLLEVVELTMDLVVICVKRCKLRRQRRRRSNKIVANASDDHVTAFCSDVTRNKRQQARAIEDE